MPFLVGARALVFLVGLAALLLFKRDVVAPLLKIGFEFRVTLFGAPHAIFVPAIAAPIAPVLLRYGPLIVWRAFRLAILARSALARPTGYRPTPGLAAIEPAPDAAAPAGDGDSAIDKAIAEAVAARAHSLDPHGDRNAPRRVFGRRAAS